MNREEILKRQEAGWPSAKAEAKKGNPFSTLCYHCYGRHPPPMDSICPHEPPPLRASQASQDRKGDA